MFESISIRECDKGFDHCAHRFIHSILRFLKYFFVQTGYPLPLEIDIPGSTQGLVSDARHLMQAPTRSGGVDGTLACEHGGIARVPRHQGKVALMFESRGMEAWQTEFRETTDVWNSLKWGNGCNFDVIFSLWLRCHWFEFRRKYTNMYMLYFVRAFDMILWFWCHFPFLEIKDATASLAVVT